jgi:hypothetical protein
MRQLGAAARRGWRRVRGWNHWLRHGEEEVEALYGPNPNNISDEEKIAQAGVISGLGGGSGRSAGH